MSYNGSGTFVINSTGQPVVTGTVISSSTFNSLTADLGTGLSTAITKDGQTTTTAKIPFALGISAAVASNFAAGTVAAPSIYLSTDTGTGLYRIGANNNGYSVSGTKLLDLSSALFAVTGAATISTTLGVTGATTLSSTLGVTGATTLSSALTYGGVTLSNAVTGTGNMVLSASPTLTGTLTAAAANFSGTVATGALTVTGTGSFTTGIAVGGSTPGTGGVAFPATAVAVADANTLDDYEEGTWTPTIGGSATYTTQTGTYTKIGRNVTIKCSLQINALGTGSTTTISGLPFTAANDAVSTAVSVGYFGTLAVNVLHIGAAVQPNTSTISFYNLNAAGASASVSPAIFGAAARTDIAGIYNI